MVTTSLRSFTRILAIPLRSYLRTSTLKLFKRVSYSKPLIKIFKRRLRNGLKILVNLGIIIGKILKKLFPNGLRIPRKIMIKGLSLYKKALNLGLRMQKRHGILIGTIFISQWEIFGQTPKK